MKYKISTLGCKVNRYESEVLASILNKSGFSPCTKEEEADVYILNSCTVTATGDQKVRQTLRRGQKKNPNAVIILTGCMAQAFPKESADLIGVDIVLGTANRNRIVEHIMNFISTKQQIIDVQEHKKGEKFESMQIDDFSDRTRAYIKIQDGCDRFCSYCIIPYARGRVRSKELSQLKIELENLGQKGFKEVVLTGINLSCYGQDLGLNLYDAIELACSTKNIERVRLGSLEPELLTEDLIVKMAAQKKMCPQFHLSLQSGCDETLKRMNRHYDTDEYREIVANLRKHFDNPAITTDIMVGFPGETDEEFSQNLSFAKEILFAQAHVFAYSRRPGTRANDMSDQIPNKTKELRSHEMIAVTKATCKKYNESLVGKTFEVLFEKAKDKNVYLGHTNSYVPVLCASHVDLKGEIRTVTIENADDEYCFGRVK